MPLAVSLLSQLTDNERDKLGGAMLESSYLDGMTVFEQVQAKHHACTATGVAW